MPKPESAQINQAFADAMADARLLLEPPENVRRVWPTLVAALAFAFCALTFATAAILAPPVQLTPIVATRGPA
jgi:hypothetical protein